ncbi:hypothetical protein [Modestobacter lapidis]|nr:hypothetical protein [Modestobacter lapidis]
MSGRRSVARAVAGPAVVTLLLAGVAGCTTQPATAPVGQALPATGPAAAPDPAPAAPDPAPPAPLTAAAARTPSAMAVACADVEKALTGGVARYEVQALAEEGLGGGGSRAAAELEMDAALDRAGRAAGAVPGLAAAAAPAMTELAILRDGLAVRADLDEDDAGPWRDARDLLETWCDAQA